MLTSTFMQIPSPGSQRRCLQLTITHLTPAHCLPCTPHYTEWVHRATTISPALHNHKYHSKEIGAKILWKIRVLLLWKIRSPVIGLWKLRVMLFGTHKFTKQVTVHWAKHSNRSTTFNRTLVHYHEMPVYTSVPVLLAHSNYNINATRQ